MLFQVANYIRNCIQNIASHDGSCRAEVIGSEESRLGVDVCTGDGRFV
jgi:hypothetical protein